VPAVANANPSVGAGGNVVLSPSATNIIKVDATDTWAKQCSVQGNGIMQSGCVIRMFVYVYEHCV